MFYFVLGVRNGDCLSPLLFSLYLNDIEGQFVNLKMDGLKVHMVKNLLYADDMVVFAITPEELQHGLDLYKIWKLVIFFLP